MLVSNESCGFIGRAVAGPASGSRPGRRRHTLVFGDARGTGRGYCRYGLVHCRRARPPAKGISYVSSRPRFRLPSASHPASSTRRHVLSASVVSSPEIAQPNKTIELFLLAPSHHIIQRNKPIRAAISSRLTASHPNSEVKLDRAGVVLRWGTTREGPVLLFSHHFFNHRSPQNAPAHLCPARSARRCAATPGHRRRVDSG